MPQRHSKNNNDLAFFTYDERKKLGYGTQKERLGKDSIKPKECIFECLLAQKKDIKRFVNFYRSSVFAFRGVYKQFDIVNVFIIT
jgi:hypothetical protein